MADPKTWTFDQLGGDQKSLVLNGWSAPFGRPRKGTIVDGGITIRRNRIDYAGKTPPTIHSFGQVGKPWELSGRWMDAAIGVAGGAQSTRRAWLDFVAGEQMVRAKWGNILSYVIFINDLECKFESEAHIAWKLTADVIVDEQSPVTGTLLQVQSPLDIAANMRDLLQQANPLKLSGFSNPLALLPILADYIDNTISAINAPFDAVYNVCSALSDFETALSSDLVKIGSGLTTVQTGLANLQDATDAVVATAAFMDEQALATNGGSAGLNGAGLFSAPDMVRLTADKASADAATANFLALLADMLNLIDGATRGQPGSAHVAQANDSWESIATQTSGGPDTARALRAMNGVRFGAKPQPGKIYTIPTGK